jgi:hypothetical protein
MVNNAIDFLMGKYKVCNIRELRKKATYDEVQLIEKILLEKARCTCRHL